MRYQVIREMKDKYAMIALSRICRLLGVSRQAYYQHLWRKECLSIEEDLVVKEVLKIRQHHRNLVKDLRLMCVLR